MRVDDEGTIHRSSLPGVVRMPEECASLVFYRELVGVGLPSSYGTLGNVNRSISPSSSKLPNSMPVVWKP